MADLTWSTLFRGSTPVQDPEPIIDSQPDLSTQQQSTAGLDVTSSEFNDITRNNAISYNDYLELYVPIALSILRDKLQSVVRLIGGLNIPLRLKVCTVASLPSPSPQGQLIYVSNEVGGAVPAFSDGSAWRRTTDRVVVS